MPHEFVPERDRAFAKRPRRAMTGVEREQWQYSRSGRLDGLRFKRHGPMGRHVVDFVSDQAKVIIELDGPHHGLKAQIERDRVQDTWLESRGYQAIRVSNAEVQRNILGVLTAIEEAVRSPGALSQPSPARGEGPATGPSGSAQSSPDAPGKSVATLAVGPGAFAGPSPR